jgi:hypothetical protein
MVYRGPGYLAVLRFGTSPAPSPAAVCKLDRRHTGRLRKREDLVTEEKGERVQERSQIIHSTERKPVLYKLFNTLCLQYFTCHEEKIINNWDKKGIVSIRLVSGIL